MTDYQRDYLWFIGSWIMVAAPIIGVVLFVSGLYIIGAFLAGLIFSWPSVFRLLKDFEDHGIHNDR